jgi:hypothetical protein
MQDKAVGGELLLDRTWIRRESRQFSSKMALNRRIWGGNPCTIITGYAGMGGAVSDEDSRGDRISHTPFDPHAYYYAYSFEGAMRLGARSRSLHHTCGDSQSTQKSAAGYLKKIAPDGRIHASFNSLNADTGRFSCSNPNLQNVGRNKEMRSCFVAAPGCKLVIADLSQIELPDNKGG